MWLNPGGLAAEPFLVTTELYSTSSPAVQLPDCELPHKAGKAYVSSQGPQLQGGPQTLLGQIPLFASFPQPGRPEVAEPLG